MDHSRPEGSYSHWLTLTTGDKRVVGHSTRLALLQAKRIRLVGVLYQVIALC